MLRGLSINFLRWKERIKSVRSRMGSLALTKSDASRKSKPKDLSSGACVFTLSPLSPRPHVSYVEADSSFVHTGVFLSKNNFLALCRPIIFVLKQTLFVVS